MKHFVLAAIIAGAVMPLNALRQPERAAMPSNAMLKQLNMPKSEGRMRAASPVFRLPADAPANTVEVPFTHDLGKAGTEVANYTFVNANDDNRKWQYHSVNGYAACMVPNAENIDNNDDWLFTVPIHLPAGNYVVSYEVGIMGTGALAVSMDTWIGREPSVEGMLAEVVPNTRYTEKSMTKYEYNCAIPEEGYYYLGMHCTTAKADKGTLKLANLGMREGTVEPPVTTDPPAAGELTWTLAPKGGLTANLKYTAPTKTVGGNDLEEISKVIITSRWEVDKFTYENVKPGEVIELEVPMYQGYNNRFTAIAYTGDVAGEKVEYKNIFCGKDIPLAPANVRLTVDPGYKSATLTWTAPGEVGENGGYVDTEALTYYVFDAFGSFYDPAILTTDKTVATLDYTGLDGQDYFAYQVTAGYGENYSLDTASNVVVAGEPAPLPFTESFRDGYYDGMWLIDVESTGSGTQNWGTVDDSWFASMADPDDPDAPKALASQDGDNGFYFWLPYVKDAMFGLVSTRTDISKAEQPVLEFWYQGEGSTLDVLLAGGVSDLQVAETIKLKDSPTTGWTLARVPLDAYKESGAVMFEIRLTATDNDDEHTYSVPFDNIRIRDLAAKEMRVVNFAVPGKVIPGKDYEAQCRVENLGTETAVNSVAVLSVNGKIVEEYNLPEVAVNGFENFTIPFMVPVNAPEETVLSLEVKLDGEATPADNTADVAVKVERKPFATVTDLVAASNEGRVELTWSTPVNDASAPCNIAEDFENEEYVPMSINGAGGWTVYDGDGVKTYNIFREEYNPYQTQPIGFQLFNREIAQVPASYWDDAAAHSGKQFMMAPSALGALNDNHLISPELSGNAQTVTFWARSYMLAWPETMSFNYSTSGKTPEDFTNTIELKGLTTDGEVPEEWTLFTVELPAGAKYFEIVHDSYDSLALFIDDITYEGMPEIPADLTVEGYYVVRNGDVLTDQPVSGNKYTDTPDVAEGVEQEFTYSVIPSYNHGLAAEGNKAVVTVKGISTAIEEIDAESALKADIYSLDGVKVCGKVLKGNVYIVVKDGKASKAIIR